MKEPKKAGRRKPPVPPGGKALERLRQFEQERGLEPTDIQETDAGQQKKDNKETPPEEGKTGPDRCH